METNWGTYRYTLRRDTQVVVAFSGEYSSYAVYIINFLEKGEAFFWADRVMMELDIRSYLPPTKINLTLSVLEQELKTMKQQESLEADFRKYLQQKSN